MDSHDTLAAKAASAAAQAPQTVSGLYQGDMMLPQPGRFTLELRVDIDPRNMVSPVTNRISGDLYQISNTTLPGQPAQVARTYIESWIVDHPEVTISEDHVDVGGAVRFWIGNHPATTMAMRITWPGSPPAVAAEATFTETGGLTRKFNCRRGADHFREVQMEIDVCASVNRTPLLPSYDTSWHDVRPAGLPSRVLTLESAYEEAGVRVSIEPDHSVIDDAAPEFKSWTPAELHDAMETHFSHFSRTGPQWRMWGLMAGQFENALVGGIMFDAASVSGAANLPERQGFAVFRKHQWFDDLVPDTPQNQDQAHAMRQFLYTWVHEAGHAYNFLHAWDKGRPDALSWMNYDWRYEQRNGDGTFWKRFAFRFDDDELIHLRHGNRAAVIMGGDPWSSGSHLEAPNLAMTQIEGHAPLEFVVRSKQYFDFMEPVIVELRLRNLLDIVPVTIDKRLAPEYGGVAIYIQKPDGRIIQYDPIICAVGTPDPQVLAGAKQAKPGEDRYSREVFLSYGSSNFYFDHPGEYRIRAVYQGPGDVLIPSEAHRVRIGVPASKELDRAAQDYFTDEAGLALYFQGSRSPYLEKGTTVLRDLADRHPDTELGAKISVALANGVSRPFFRMQYDQQDPQKGATITKSAEADPKQALALTKPALALYRNTNDKSANLAYSRVVRRRAEYHAQAGSAGQAKRELLKLASDLKARDANEPVVNQYVQQANNLPGTPNGGGGGGRRPRKLQRRASAAGKD